MKDADQKPASKESEEKISRREALAKLAKFSAYSAPTVVTLLAAKPSLTYAASPPPYNEPCTGGRTANYGLQDGKVPRDETSSDEPSKNTPLDNCP
jgi:hypothetical protein